MKKLLFIFATAALFGACEKKTEVAAPAAPAVQNTPDPAKAQRLNRKTAPTNPNSLSTTETKTDALATEAPSPTP